MSHRIRINFLMTGELVCCSTREVGTAKQTSQKRFCLANTARHKHNSGFQALTSLLVINLRADIAPRVIHRYATDAPASAKSGQSRFMHPLRKIVVARALALALFTLAIWQQQATGADAETAPQIQPWQSPIEAPIHLVRPFFQPNSDYSAGHRGVDYRVALGQDIYAPTEGTIWFVGEVADRNLISLRTKTGDLLEFEPACSQLIAGQEVFSGQTIASVCEARESYRQHCDNQRCLHFSLRTTLGYLSPLVRYGTLAPTILLPAD